MKKVFIEINNLPVNKLAVEVVNGYYKLFHPGVDISTSIEDGKYLITYNPDVSKQHILSFTFLLGDANLRGRLTELGYEEASNVK